MGVGFDVEEGGSLIDFGAKDFEHLDDELDVTFLGQLAHEDAEGGDITGLVAGLTFVAESS